jgi:hypothetical protein
MARHPKLGDARTADRSSATTHWPPAYLQGGPDALHSDVTKGSGSTVLVSSPGRVLPPRQGRLCS